MSPDKDEEPITGELDGRPTCGTPRSIHGHLAMTIGPATRLPSLRGQEAPGTRHPYHHYLRCGLVFSRCNDLRQGYDSYQRKEDGEEVECWPSVYLPNASLVTQVYDDLRTQFSGSVEGKGKGKGKWDWIWKGIYFPSRTDNACSFYHTDKPTILNRTKRFSRRDALKQQQQQPI